MEKRQQILVIERVLKQLGLNKTWLADTLGISRSQVTRILNGERRWTAVNQEKAARALGWDRNGKGPGLFVVQESARQVIVNARYGWALGHVTDAELDMVEAVFGARGEDD